MKQAEFLLTDSPKHEPSRFPAGEGGMATAQTLDDDSEEQQLLSPNSSPLTPATPPTPAAKLEGGFKSISENAATYPRAAARETSALALTALGEAEAVELLDKAIRQELRGLKSRRRRAELRGALIDADVENKSLSDGLSSLDRAAVWSWRASRRVRRNRERIGKLSLYGAAGAALAVGLLRALITFPGYYALDTSPGVQFNAAFYFTAICVLVLLFGMTLAESLLTPPAVAGDLVLAPVQGASRGSLRAAATIVGAGALVFGAANVVMIMFSQFSLDVPLQMIAPGLIVGLGFAAVLYMPLRGGRRAGAWALSLGVAASVLALTQLYFIVFRVFNLPPSDPSAAGFFLVWNGGEYKRLFDLQSWPRGWLDVLGLLDAAALGAAATAGATLGLAAANRSLAKGLLSPGRVSD